MEKIVKNIPSSHWCSCSRLFNGHSAKWNDDLIGQNSVAEWTPFLSFFFLKIFYCHSTFVCHFNIFLCSIDEAVGEFSFTFLIWVSGVRVLVFCGFVFFPPLVFHFFHLFSLGSFYFLLNSKKVSESIHTTV